MFSRLVLKSLLATARVGVDGVYGHDLTVKDPRFVWKALTEGGTLALGRAYMDGRVTARHIDVALEQLAHSWLGRLPNFEDLRYWLKGLLGTDHQSVECAQRVTGHYNMSPQMYEAMLGPTMCYTSALGMHDRSLDQAQVVKVNAMVDRLHTLRPGDRVADIGCGFGTTLIELARRGVRPIGVSNAKGHVDYARERCKKVGVEPKFSLGDWREFQESVDHMTSTEMIEAVGRRHLEEYFRWARWLLDREDGREHVFSLQAIHTTRWLGDGRDGFLGEYIFPGGELPRCRDLERAWGQYFHLAEEPVDFGLDYARTLRQWRKNLATAKDEVVLEISERGYRMMEFYLALCEVSFSLRINSVRQYTLVAK